MTVQVDLSMRLKLGDSSYGIGVTIPSAEPKPDKPYILQVHQFIEDESEKVVNSAETMELEVKESKDELLTVVVGGKNAFYVAVSPPSVIDDLTGGIVEDINVVVNEGGYNPASHLFEKLPPEPPKEKLINQNLEITGMSLPEAEI